MVMYIAPAVLSLFFFATVVVDAQDLDLRRIEEESVIPRWKQNTWGFTDTCITDATAVYNDTAFASAFNAYIAAEKVSFAESCDVPPADGLVQSYDCQVSIGTPTLLDNYDTACAAAGGIVGKFGPPSGIGCCGDPQGSFVIYGFSTTDNRWCIPASCGTEQWSRFLEQYLFNAGTSKFQGDLGLQCGIGCAIPQCSDEQVKIQNEFGLAQAQFLYYAAMTTAFASCFQDAELSPNNFECTDMQIEQAKIDDYEDACKNLGGVLNLSDEIEVSCEDSANDYKVEVSFPGTYTCVSEWCDLEESSTLDIIKEATKFSPASVFSNYEDLAEAQGLACRNESGNGNTDGDVTFKVGMIIGIAVGGVVVLFCGAFIYMRRRKGKTASPYEGFTSGKNTYQQTTIPSAFPANHQTDLAAGTPLKNAVGVVEPDIVVLPPPTAPAYYK